MKNCIFIFFILLGSCANTPLKPLSKDAVIKDIVLMNPDQKKCQYQRTVTRRDWLSGGFSKVMSEVNHLAVESRANVGRVLSVKTMSKIMKVELYRCPEDYVSDYKKRNFLE